MRLKVAKVNPWRALRLKKKFFNNPYAHCRKLSERICSRFSNSNLTGIFNGLNNPLYISELFAIIVFMQIQAVVK
jgi:hypothetical protein